MRQLLIRNRRQEMYGRQTLDLQTSRFVTDEDPVPVRPLTRSLLNQFLIDQPRFDGAEITDPRMRDPIDLLGYRNFAASDGRPVIKIHRLLEQVRLLARLVRLRKQFTT